MYARRLQPLLRELLAEFRIVYLTGPRQAGKTTLARSVSRDLGLEYVTLDDQATLASVQSDPHGFLRSLGDKRAVLDEFQYVPALIPTIKEISDRLDPHEKGKFLLTGSADIFRSARTQESLPGHMVRLELLPLSVTELYGQPLNVIDHLSAGEFTHVPAASATREVRWELDALDRQSPGRVRDAGRHCRPGAARRLPGGTEQEPARQAGVVFNSIFILPRSAPED